MPFDGNRCDIVMIEKNTFERPTDLTFAKEPWLLPGRKRNFKAMECNLQTRAACFHVSLLAGPAVEKGLRKKVRWKRAERGSFIRGEELISNLQDGPFWFDSLNVYANLAIACNRVNRQAARMRHVKPQASGVPIAGKTWLTMGGIGEP